MMFIPSPTVAYLFSVHWLQASITTITTALLSLLSVRSMFVTGISQREKPSQYVLHRLRQGAIKATNLGSANMNPGWSFIIYCSVDSVMLSACSTTSLPSSNLWNVWPHGPHVSAISAFPHISVPCPTEFSSMFIFRSLRGTPTRLVL